MNGAFTDFEFGLTAAKDLLDKYQVLTFGKRYKRRDIVQILVDQFLARGGAQDAIPLDPARRVKKILPPRDESNERFRNLGYGMYEYLGQSSEAPPSSEPTAIGSRKSIMPDREWGGGPYEVYAWCLPQDENSDDRWPIKIGFAGEGGFERRWQDFSTHLPVVPRYLIALRFDSEGSGRRAESYLHGMLGDDGHGRRIKDIPGQEWFRTSPDEIEQFVRHRFPHLKQVN